MHKKTIHRILSSALIFTVLSNTIVPFADNAEQTQNDKQSSLLQYEQASSYTVSIPKNIILQGSNLHGVRDVRKTSTYTINVKGDILGTETISVVPDNSFVMHDKNGKTDVSAAVGQDKTNFSETEITGAGENGIDETGSISADLTSGDWSGILNFAINCDQNDTKEIGQVSLYDADGNLLVSAEELGVNVERNYVIDNGWDDETEEDIEIFEEDSLYEKLKSYPTATKAIVSNNVKNIGNNVFCACINLKEIELPDNLKSIGKNSFERCINLTKINLSDNIEAIGSLAFLDCEKLEEIHIPNKITELSYGTFSQCKMLDIEIPENITYIGNFAFAYTALSSINLNDNITYIGNGAFEGTNISEITIPESINEIKDFTFANCKNIQSFEIPDHIKIIGSRAFCGTSIESIIIPEQITKIESYTFLGCSKLKSITLNENITEMGNSAFEGCILLKSMKVPENVAEINFSVFDGCSSLEEVKIPSNINLIKYHAFYNCSKLNNIELPASIKTLEYYAFDNCTSLNNIIYDGLRYKSKTTLEAKLKNNGVSVGRDVFQNTSLLTKEEDGIPVLAGIYDTNNQMLASWDDLNYDITKNYTVEDSITGKAPFSSDAFICNVKKYPTIATVVLPEGTESIGQYAFDRCNITSIILPESLTTLNKSSFYKSNISKITLPSNITVIPEYAFFTCCNLKSITIGNDVTEIGKDAFYACHKLNEITLPDNLKVIGDNAFTCSSIKYITYKGTTYTDYNKLAVALEANGVSIGKDILASTQVNNAPASASYGSVNSIDYDYIMENYL